MAKGHRGRQQTTQANGPSGKSNKSAAVDKENANDTHNNLQSGKGRNRNREKPKIIVSFSFFVSTPFQSVSMSARDAWLSNGSKKLNRQVSYFSV